MPRDSFRRYQLAEIEAMPILSSRTLDPPLDFLIEEVKLEDPPGRPERYRYSLVRDTRMPRIVPTRVIYREYDDQSGRWNVIPIYSLSYLISPMERAALDANERGDRVSALLLIHALLETLMRSDPIGDYRTRDGFAEIVEEFSRRLVDRGLPDVDPSALKSSLLAVNEKRNDVIHRLVTRYGLEGTNARLTPADFAAWKGTYEATLNTVMEFVSL